MFSIEPRMKNTPPNQVKLPPLYICPIVTADVLLCHLGIAC